MADDKHAEARGPAGPVSSRIDLETVRQLATLMGEHDLAELEVEQEDMVVRLRKTGAPGSAAVSVVPVGAPVAAAASAAAPAGARKEDLPAILSPMVGTFYVASGPDAAPYVKEGDQVTEDTVVCVIEAMKVFNEIRAEMTGTIEAILVKNAQAVEFGQRLFVVRPD